ncbi:MAG: hypothetical protein OXP71_15215 [Candidatus Poribacteria bacterium]|nr:hypothetical protein [Candidatus Poribacteria bacterium]
MNLDFHEMMISIVFPIIFGFTAIYFLTVGLRGILTKQPFLVSNRWVLSMMFVVLIPMILLNVSSSLSLPGSFNVMNWVTLLILLVVLLMMWYQLKGYTAYAVTDASFREALLAALEKLQLPYEESLSVIRLTTVDVDLQVAIQSWMGTGIIKVKQRGYNSVFREVVNAMNEYFRNSSVPTKMISCVFYLVTGGIMVAFAIGMFFIGRNFGTI